MIADSDHMIPLERPTPSSAQFVTCGQPCIPRQGRSKQQMDLTAVTSWGPSGFTRTGEQPNPSNGAIALRFDCGPLYRAKRAPGKFLLQ